MSELKSSAKPFEISKWEVWEAFRQVRENQGAAGVDGVSIDGFEADPEIGCIVITGNEKAFAAGVDIKEMHKKTFVEAYGSDFIAPFDRISYCRKPIIAAVNGWAMGGGFWYQLAADITIEGKIEGGGSVRIAGKFKGDVNVQGDLTIETGAKLTGSVRADKVTIAGELEGNVVEASRVDLLQTAVMIGDLKAGSLTVTAGARMRGQAEFGWDDGKGPKAGKPGNGA